MAANAILFTTPWRRGLAAIGARAAQCIYSTTAGPGGPVGRFGAALGAVQSTILSNAGNGFIPNVAIWKISPAGYAVAFGGVTSLRQYLAYFLGQAQGVHPPAQGRVTDYVAAQYNLIAPAIFSALESPMAGRSGCPISVFGHSAGGGYAQMFMADLIANHDVEFSRKSCYLYGAPRIGNQAFVTSLAGENIFNVRYAGDPISGWPNDLIYRAIEITGPMVGLVNVLLSGGRYSTTGQCRELDSIGATTIVRAFSDLSLAQQQEIIATFLREGELPSSHRIENYVRALFMGWRASMRSNSDEDLSRLFDSLEAFDAPNSPLDLQTPITNLPQLRPPNTMPAPPAGGAATMSRSAIRLSGVTSISFGSTGRRRQRVAVGDGHAHRMCHKMRQLMAALDKQSGDVSSGRRNGTMFIQNPLYWNSEVQAAWWRIQSHLDQVLQT
jgi:hypothetical protein